MYTSIDNPFPNRDGKPQKKHNKCPLFVGKIDCQLVEHGINTINQQLKIACVSPFTRGLTYQVSNAY